MSSDSIVVSKIYVLSKITLKLNNDIFYTDT